MIFRNPGVGLGTALSARFPLVPFGNTHLVISVHSSRTARVVTAPPSSWNLLCGLTVQQELELVPLKLERQHEPANNHH